MSKNTNIIYDNDPRIDEKIVTEPSPEEIESRIHMNLKLPINTEHELKHPQMLCKMRFINVETSNPFKYLPVMVPEFGFRGFTDKHGYIYFPMRYKEKHISKGIIVDNYDLGPLCKNKREFTFTVGNSSVITKYLSLPVSFLKLYPPFGPGSIEWLLARGISVTPE